MRFEFFIALRHLMSRERRALISIITAISIIGVVVGVAALVVVISVMDGADQEYMKQLTDVYAHIEISGSMGELADYGEVMKLVNEEPEVVASSPILKRFAAFRLKSSPYGNAARTLFAAQVMGVDPNLEGAVTRIGEKNKDVIGERIPKDGEVVLGVKLAEDMGVRLGDEIFGMSGKYATTGSAGAVPKQSNLKVVGFFKSGVYEVDKTVAYMSIATCQRLNLLDDVVDAVHLRLKDRNLADKVKARLMEKLGPLYRVYTWGEINPSFFYALKLEKLGMFIILLLVIIVAALNIISTLILVTMEKTREIGILRAMGTSRRSIRRIFMLEGAFIGIAGTLIGTALGYFLCYLLKNHVRIELPEAVYAMDRLPVKTDAISVLIIMASSVAISLLASVIPAIQAARLKIVEALRYE